MPERILITVSNLTPLTVTVNQVPASGPRTLITTLAPFDSHDQEAVVGSSWEMNDQYSGQVVAKLAVTDQTTECTIAHRLRSRSTFGTAPPYAGISLRAQPATIAECVSETRNPERDGPAFESQRKTSSRRRTS